METILIVFEEQNPQKTWITFWGSQNSKLRYFRKLFTVMIINRMHLLLRRLGLSDYILVLQIFPVSLSLLHSILSLYWEYLPLRWDYVQLYPCIWLDNTCVSYSLSKTANTHDRLKHCITFSQQMQHLWDHLTLFAPTAF